MTDMSTAEQLLPTDGYDEIKHHPETPTFYVFKGVSGAGCSTAIDRMVELGLVQLSPPEFTTRALRPGEVKGRRHHPVTKSQLDKVRRQIAVVEELFGNEYGFFKPAIRRMQAMLASQNVVIDSNTPPQVWKQVIGDYPLVSVFFAPQDPRFAIDRIVSRATQQQDQSFRESLLVRAQDNVKIMEGIRHFDYWVDTTHLASVFSAVESIIRATSFGVNPEAIESLRIDTAQGSETANRLVESYQDPMNIEYAIALLGL